MLVESTKPIWHKPELVILVRSKPEESVLTVCKTTNLDLPGPFKTAEVHGCTDEGNSCAACQARPLKAT